MAVSGEFNLRKANDAESEGRVEMERFTFIFSIANPWAQLETGQE